MGYSNVPYLVADKPIKQAVIELGTILTTLRKTSDTGYIPPPPFPHEKSTSQPGD